MLNQFDPLTRCRQSLHTGVLASERGLGLQQVAVLELPSCAVVWPVCAYTCTVSVPKTDMVLLQSSHTTESFSNLKALPITWEKLVHSL